MSAAAAPTLSIIDDSYLWRNENGLVLSFKERAAHAPSDTDAVRARQILNPFSVTNELKKNRKIIAAPQVVAQLSSFGDDGPGIKSAGIIIKKKDSFDIGLPECFGFAAGMAEVVGDDLLRTYGADGFKDSVIRFVAQRDWVGKGAPQRQSFAGWHDHIEGSARIDLIYSFANKIPTEYKIKGKIVAQPEYSLTRFGSEVKHRSPNNGGNEIYRTWGAFIVEPDSTGWNTKNQNGGANAALERPSKREEFRAAADELLVARRGELIHFPRPIILTPDYYAPAA